MKLIFNRQDNTYLYFFVTSFCILVYAIATLFLYGDKTIFVNITGRNIAVNHFELSILFKIAYLVLALGYFIARRLKFNLNKSLTRIHTYITIGAAILNAAVMLSGTKYQEIMSIWLISIAAIAQLLFFINLGIGISRRNGDYYPSE